MQPVYKDGSLGQEINVNNQKEFEEKLNALMKQHESIDHVRVFNKEDPESNKVGLSEIENKDLETKIESLIEKKLKEAEQRNDILKTFNILKNSENI
jgi:L-lactate utilization protein LutC